MKAGRTTALSTALILIGLAATRLILPSDSAGDIFTVAAIGVGVALSIATIIEGTTGIRNLIRVDILILWVLYGLTFLEFLFPQPAVDGLLSTAAAVSGTDAVLIGFAGLAVGRHLVPRPKSRNLSAFMDLRPAYIFLLFVVATLLGYLHILIAVNFDPFEMVRQMSLPRFSQSWGRGQYGDAYALLFEIGALIYLIPPIAGLIYARPKEYGLTQKAFCTVVLILTLYYGFSSGTRNVFVTYVITLVGSYCLAKRQFTLRQALVLGVPTLVLLLLATVYMLEFRSVGLSNFSVTEENQSFFVDLNIVNVSRLTEVFPDSIEFLGLEIPFNAVIRPIPRVLWPDKPVGLSVTIESALAASAGMTLSCTFIGEAYMAGGLLAVLLFSLGFGVAAELWNRVVSNSNAQFVHLLYVSGFLCAALAMRSMLSMVPLMLPTLALWLFGKVWLSRLSLRGATAKP
jgi:oligosaccharide repeat unit polymerase